MFYFWHTAIVILFLVFSFFMGYKLGKKKNEYKITYNEKPKVGKCPMGFN